MSNVSDFKDKLKSIQDKLSDIEGVHLHDIRRFCDGNLKITKNGKLKLPLSLPAGEVMKDPTDLRSVIEGKWKIIPILMFVEE